MDIGVFIPIGNNGWLISEDSPQYKPSFDLNKQVTVRAEHYGLDFVLSMIKLRGLGGRTEFWDYNLESFTLMAGLAAVTSKIKLYATAPVLALPPAIVARMSTTIDSISKGRFGVNLTDLIYSVSEHLHIMISQQIWSPPASCVLQTPIWQA
jgi:pyrimidine oxygenase